MPIKIVFFAAMISLGAAAQDAGVLVAVDPKVLVNHPERLVMPGLPNLSRVGPGVYRGGRPELELGGPESQQKLGTGRRSAGRRLPVRGEELERIWRAALAARAR